MDRVVRSLGLTRHPKITKTQARGCVLEGTSLSALQHTFWELIYKDTYNKQQQAYLACSSPTSIPAAEVCHCNIRCSSYATRSDTVDHTAPEMATEQSILEITSRSLESQLQQRSFQPSLHQQLPRQLKVAAAQVPISQHPPCQMAK